MGAFKGQSDTASSPASKLHIVVPDTPLPEDVKGLWVGVGGDVEILAVGDTVSVVLPNAPSGCVLPVQAQIVVAAGTTASRIVALL